MKKYFLISFLVVLFGVSQAAAFSVPTGTINPDAEPKITGPGSVPGSTASCKAYNAQASCLATCPAGSKIIGGCDGGQNCCLPSAADVAQAKDAKADAGTGSECAGKMEGGICFPTNTGLSDQPVVVLLGKVMFWLLGLVGVIAIIAFVIAGMQYLAAAGDPKLAEKGKTNMLNAIVGIIVALSGLVVLQAIDTLFTGTKAVF